jgi:trans-aconitate 2-methyltransferase
LKPFLDALDDAQRERFLADFSQTIAAAYPAQADGRTLYSFRRLFIYAVR